MALGIRCRTYNELTAALATRRRELGLRQLEVDQLAGFPDQYCGKLEIGTRGVGRMSLPTWLETLGLDLILIAREPKADHRVVRRTHMDPALGRTLSQEIEQ
jgi:hypothetical protein